MSVNEGFDDVVAEIEAETERRRASGVYPAELLERLDSEFDRFAPISFRRTGVEGAIRAVESAAFINVDPPVDSSRRAARAVKVGVKKGTAWYHLHVARQVTTLGIQVTRPLRMLHEGLESLTRRVADLEDAVGQQSPELSSMVSALTDRQLLPSTVAGVSDLFTGKQGRIAHLGATDIGVVQALVDSGVDAYGIAPGGGGGLDLEIRAERPMQHLRDLGTGSLGGAVVSGIAETATTPERVELCHLLCDRVASGGRIAIVAVDPDRWAGEVGPVTADLVPAGPLRAETWIHLLEEAGARAPHAEPMAEGRVLISASAS